MCIFLLASQQNKDWKVKNQGSEGRNQTRENRKDRIIGTCDRAEKAYFVIKIKLQDSGSKEPTTFNFADIGSIVDENNHEDRQTYAYDAP